MLRSRAAATAVSRIAIASGHNSTAVSRAGVAAARDAPASWSIAPFATSPHPTASAGTASSASAQRRLRILATGAQGQIGSELVARLRARGHFVLATDIQRPSRGNAGLIKDKESEQNEANHKFGGKSKYLDPSCRYDDVAGGFKYLDVLDAHAVSAAVVDHGVDTVLHLSSLLSAVGEKQYQRALEVNVLGLNVVLEACKRYNCALFAPSSIAAFGPSTPRVNTPDVTIMRPTTVYGVSKLYTELLGEWYFKNQGVDFRSVRYAGVLSSETLPGGGTTDYAIQIFHDALQSGHHKCFLAADAGLPMIHMEDTLTGTIQLLEAPRDKLTQCTYNLGAVSFTPKELYETVRARRAPELTIEYAPDFRQQIAETWPMSLDISKATQDWGYNPQYKLDRIVDVLFDEIKDLYYSDKKSS